MSDLFHDLGFFDPWVGDPVQSTHTRAFCQIIIAGLDVTDAVRPYLISVRIIDGGEYKAEIELDDRDGQLPIPPFGSTVDIYLGWAADAMVLAFSGTIQDLEHGGGRKQGGRRMWVHAQGADFLNTAIKQPFQQHWGEGAPPGQDQGTGISLLQALSAAAALGGGSAMIHPNFATVMRDYWAMSNESPIHFFQRITGDVGGQFRVQSGNTFVITAPGQNADGTDAPTITAQWGVNLLSWRVRPIAARGVWSGAQQQWFSTRLGKWNQLSQMFGLPAPWAGGSAVYQLPAPAGTQQQGQQEVAGAQEQGYYGEGRIAINGEPYARWQGNVNLLGVRPGVDGSYWISQAEHVYSRQGYITWLDVYPNINASGDNSVGNGYPAVAPPEPVQPATPENALPPNAAP